MKMRMKNLQLYKEKIWNRHSKDSRKLIRFLRILQRVQRDNQLTKISS